jgi:AcrR family transcriptional regulator
MVHILHSGENIEKLSTIIETAQKRFGLYGLQKTTMREIASDLKMSKGSLYYYFPDKENLYKAVVEKEHEEFALTLMEKTKDIQNPQVKLEEYTEIRMDYFRKLMNLSRFSLEEFRGIKSIMGDAWLIFRKRETAIIVGILEEGKRKGIFNIQNIEETAALFLDLLKGLRDTIITKKEFFYLEQEEYNMLVQKSKAFTEIFIKGLCCSE